MVLVESNQEDASFLKEVLSEIEAGRYWKPFVSIQTVHVADWPDAAAALVNGRVDLLLLTGDFADQLRRAQAIAPQVPVILLIDSIDDLDAVRLMRDGAQDFLLKRSVHCAPLVHAMRNAIERHRLLTSARAGASLDSLTGLPNRSGFTTLAERDRKLAERLGRRMMLWIAQPRNLEEIASAFGDQRRDLALVEAADHLRVMLGPTDLVARISCDSFGLATIETNLESLESVWARFHRASDAQRIRIGAAMFQPDRPVSLDTLLEQAAADLVPSALAARP
ncbi:MAG TPA: diguanylate cyclase [Bryobacteraceae bacterium]|nr:diguanylate cyclase [Bryobacteraceae bacterium]